MKASAKKIWNILLNSHSSKKRLQGKYFLDSSENFFWYALQIHYMYSTLKQRGNYGFNMEYTWCICRELFYRTEVLLHGWKNFFLGSRLFGCAVLLAHPSIGHAKNKWSKPKCTSNRDTTKNIAICSSLPKQDLQLSI